MLKQQVFLLGILLVCATVVISDDNEEFPSLSGAYLGQTPPNSVPQVFAANIISTDLKELNSVFSPDGKEFFFARMVKEDFCVIYHSRLIDDHWTVPRVAPFSGEYSDVDMAFSPDGKKLYYCSNRQGSIGKMDIFVSHKIDGEWSSPENIGNVINSEGVELYPCVTKDGSMYFSADRPGSLGKRDVYYSQNINGTFQTPVWTGSTINSVYGEGDPFVAPDESYMIVSCWGKPDSLGRSDLYISFRNEDGKWSTLVNMGPTINSSTTDYCPMVTPDGKYLFYTRNDDIYWVSLDVIWQFREES